MQAPGHGRAGHRLQHALLVSGVDRLTDGSSIPVGTLGAAARPYGVATQRGVVAFGGPGPIAPAPSGCAKGGPPTTRRRLSLWAEGVSRSLAVHTAIHALTARAFGSGVHPVTN